MAHGERRSPARAPSFEGDSKLRQIRLSTTTHALPRRGTLRQSRTRTLPPMPPRRWFDSAWPDLADLADGDEVGLVPVGAVEQHGPHLPTGTDTIIATLLCERVSERCGAIVLPAIPVGCSYGHSVNLPGEPLADARAARRRACASTPSGPRRPASPACSSSTRTSATPRRWRSRTDHLRLFRPDLQVGFVELVDARPDRRGGVRGRRRRPARQPQRDLGDARARARARAPRPHGRRRRPRSHRPTSCSATPRRRCRPTA